MDPGSLDQKNSGRARVDQQALEPAKFVKISEQVLVVGFELPTGCTRKNTGFEAWRVKYRNGATFLEMPEAFRRLQGRLLKRLGGDKKLVEILSLVLHHNEQAVLYRRPGAGSRVRFQNSHSSCSASPDRPKAR